MPQSFEEQMRSKAQYANMIGLGSTQCITLSDALRIMRKNGKDERREGFYAAMQLIRQNLPQTLTHFTYPSAIEREVALFGPSPRKAKKVRKG